MFLWVGTAGGSTVQEAFVQTAYAMFGYMTNPSLVTLDPGSTTTIEVEGAQQVYEGSCA